MTSSRDPHKSAKSAKQSIGFSLPSKASDTKLAKVKPASSLGKRTRSTLAPNRDNSSDDEPDHKDQDEVIVEFSEDGAIKRGDKSGPLVIKGLKNRDWKSEARARRRGKNLLPPEVIAAAKENAVQAKVEGDRSVMQDNVNTEWGLNIRQRQRTEKAVSPTPEAQSNLAPISEEAQTSEKVKEKSLNLDEEALQALLKKDKVESCRELVIPVEDSLQPVEPMTEYDVYQRAVAAAPEPSNMEDYERVPVEEFGAALLRGMGWNGKKIGGMKEVKRRQNLLGLGAKELKEAEFLGAWVNKSDAKKLNTNLTGGKDRRPRAGEYMREEEKRRERREERVGGSYRREREFDTRQRDRSRERERSSRR